MTKGSLPAQSLILLVVLHNLSLIYDVMQDREQASRSQSQLAHLLRLSTEQHHPAVLSFESKLYWVLIAHQPRTDQIKKPHHAMDNRSIGRCNNCEKTEREGKGEFIFCGERKKVVYCSQQCQRAHWEEHRLDCTKGAPKTPEEPKELFQEWNSFLLATRSSIPRNVINAHGTRKSF